MSETLLKGKFVRITMEDPKTLADIYARWSRDSEFWRLMDSGITHPVSQKAMEKFIENVLEENPVRNYPFSVRTLSDNCIIGDVGLGGINWARGDAFVGIGLGDRDYWGKGYGTDAMQVILRFAFQELNLRRVSLNVFEYNPRAIRSYEKVGFQHEGRVRKSLSRAGQRWDTLYMGILNDEWRSINENSKE